MNFASLFVSIIFCSIITFYLDTLSLLLLDLLISQANQFKNILRIIKVPGRIEVKVKACPADQTD